MSRLVCSPDDKPRTNLNYVKICIKLPGADTWKKERTTKHIALFNNSLSVSYVYMYSPCELLFFVFEQRTTINEDKGLSKSTCHRQHFVKKKL